MTLASAQRLDTAAPPRPTIAGGATAERYEPVFEALRKLAPRGDSVATVHHLTLQRDAIRFQLEEGTLYLATPVEGRTIAAIFVGIIDTMGRAFLPNLLRQMLSSAAASTAAPALSSMLIYLVMAIVLVVRPEGLFPANRR